MEHIVRYFGPLDLKNIENILKSNRNSPKMTLII